MKINSAKIWSTRRSKRFVAAFVLVAFMLIVAIWWLPASRASALSLVTTCNVTGNSIASCTSVQIGDLLVVFAYNNSSSTAPTKPATFTQISSSLTNTGSGTNGSCNQGWKIAASNSEGSNTWTNATAMVMHVYRGVNASSPIGANIATQSGNNSGTTVTYGNGTTSLTVADGTSWWVAFGARTAGQIGKSALPTGMTLQSSAADPVLSFPIVWGSDTNGGTSSNWTAVTVGTFTNSVKYLSVLIEIKGNHSPGAPTLSSPSNGSTITSTTPNLQMSATDTEGDAIKYKVVVYNTTATSGGNCTGSVFETGDQTSSGTGWNNGTTAYTSGATATYTIQSALTRGSGYCWQAQGLDPSGSNVFGTSSSAFTFTVNATPAAPTLSAPASGATGVSTVPQFQLKTTDANSDYVQYRVYLYQSDCTTAVGTSPFNESSSQTGWSGQDAGPGGNTAYTGSTVIGSSTLATYTYQSTLTAGTTYCWKADAVDPAGSNTFSSATATQSFTTAVSSAVSIQGGTTIQGGTIVQ